MKRLFLTNILIFATVAAVAETKEIHILAVNDMHATIDRFPRFAALVEGIRAKHPGLLVFSAGDNRTGNPVNDMHPEPSHPMLTLMNKVGFNLSCMGNHEFDAGTVALRRLVYRSHFRYVCANMFMPDALRLHIEPYKMFEVDGARVAVLGLLELADRGIPEAHPDNLTGIAFRPPLDVAEEYRWLRDRCDVFILLAHLAYENSVALANAYPYPDLIISGHSHTAVDHEAVDVKDIQNGVLVTQAGSHLKHATYIILEIEDGKVTKRKARLLNVEAFDREDAEVRAMVDDFNNNDVLKTVLTQVATDFKNYEELGCLMTDAVRLETGADIALQNPGGVRLKTLPKGPVTVGTIYQLDPFGNEAVEFHLDGEEVLRLIEAAYRADKGASYVSGICYDMTLDPQGQVKRVDVRMADGTPLDLQRRYKVVMNSYLAAICEYKKTDMGKDLSRLTVDLLIEHLQKQTSVDYNGVKRVKIIMQDE
ncbi:MAG: bifunctional metallophosphatase/5'-nucleotidase [Kiritimatiellaeota bacterium]|nr:bifunctional metallophosphatase/5'-nucleotidase [Kiritimatiellota bacterium]